jgi:hypothetical protein
VDPGGRSILEAIVPYHVCEAAASVSLFRWILVMTITRFAMAHAERRTAPFVLLRPFASAVIALGIGVKTLAAGAPLQVVPTSTSSSSRAAAPAGTLPASSGGLKAGSPEEEAILAVVDQFMIGISTNDFALLARIRLENSLNIVERPAPPPATGTIVTRRPFNPEGSKPGVFKERYWDPVVHVRGGLAVVWTPYEFWRDGKTSHCGVDVFEMIKDQGTWKIGNAMWTVEPDACPSLRPLDQSRLRPTQ